jgi:hypothetical protein
MEVSTVGGMARKRSHILILFLYWLRDPALNVVLCESLLPLEAGAECACSLYKYLLSFLCYLLMQLHMQCFLN